MSSDDRQALLKPALLILAICVLALAVAGYFQARSFASNLAAARTMVAQGQYAEALPLLDRAGRSLISRILDRAREVDYLKGLCLWRTGEVDAAVVSLQRLEGSSPLFGEAMLALAEVELDAGRWRDAEVIATDLLNMAPVEDGPGTTSAADDSLSRTAIEAGKRLMRYLRMQGRYQDAARLQIDRLTTTSDDPVSVLKSAWRDERGTPPYETIREAVGISEKLAAADSRTWLAKAIVATAEGRFDEADEALKRCEKPEHRPDDAVLRARLDWMRASGRTFVPGSVAWNERSGKSFFTAADKAEWAVFLARRSGDKELEKEILENWKGLNPRSTRMLSSMAEYLERAGATAEARETLRAKGDVDREIEKFGRLMTGTSKPVESPELLDWARTARAAGQMEHAEILCDLAVRKDRSNADTQKLMAEFQEARQTGAQVSARIDSLWKKALALSAGSKEPASVANASTNPAPAFVAVPENSGLRFVYDNGETEIRQMPVALGGGVGLIDFDDDDDLDVFAVQGGAFPFDPATAAGKPGDRLFRNLGGGRFEDCTEAAGLPANRVGYGLGVTVGDVNGDRLPDLFVTRFGAYALYLNEGGSRFRDVTEVWGLGGERGWPSSAAFADFDGDGDLDLYVCHYVVWDARNPRLCRNETTGRYMSCNPTTCDASPDHLLRNDGGKFVDVSESAGITAADRDGRGLGVIAADFDDDGLTDIFVANDKSANFLFRNLGGMKFEEIAQIAGVAAGSDGSYQAGMGVACGDYDNDGRFDIAVTNYYGESTTLYRNAGGMVFTDMTSATGLAAATRLRLGFGLVFADFDADGWLDMLSANGHTDDMGDVPYAMPAQLLQGTPSGRWRDMTGEYPHSPLATPRLGRGLAVGDLDGDGLVDALLLPQNEPVVFLRNATVSPGKNVSLRLTGTKSNRDGVGARIRLTTQRGVRHAQRFGGGSYQSASEGFVRLGVPAGDSARSLEVQWPSGTIDRIQGPFPDLPLRIVEGSGRFDPIEPPKRP